MFRLNVFRKILVLMLALALIISAGLSSIQAQDDGKPQPGKRSNYVNRMGVMLNGSQVNTSDPLVRNGKVRVLVELNTEPTANYTWVDEVPLHAHRLPDLVGNQLQLIRQQQGRIFSELTARGKPFRVLDTLTTSTTGVILEVNAADVDTLEQLPQVKAVHPEELVVRDLNNSVPKIGTPVAWDAGFTGIGKRIAIIDDGIDYKHTQFGGNASTVFVPGMGANAKVVGGYDLVGDAYDARVATGAGSTPIPDPDPFTCALPYPAPIFNPADTPVHHGTHVAGIAAGYGVDAAGNTFTGPYNSSVPFGSMRIGPGVAPEAQILAYRVFGCYGSTSSLIVAQAIEMAVDPNGDGNPADHADVINMSLGSAYGSGFGPYETAINSAVGLGVVVVASAGNSADSYFVTGSPAAVGSAISVAGSKAAYLEAVVNSPADIAGSYFGAGASFGPPLTSTGVTGNLVYAQPANGCAPLTNAALVAGNIALVDRGVCGFAVKVKIAQNAGATAALVCNNAAGPAIPMGGTDPTITIPSMMLSQADCNVIKSKLPGVNITLRQSSSVDTIYSSTSRGPRRGSTVSPIVLKPDVAAPGESVVSAAGNTGNGSINYSGTSMAAPHVAGFVALLRQQNPAWTTTELKALVMNTASSDIFVVPNQTTIYGPGRIGSGVINVPNAINLANGGPKVIAYDRDHPELVSISFGLVEAVFPTSRTKIIELKNKSGSPVTYNVGLQNVVTQPGTTVSVIPPVITIPANGTAWVAVRLNANPASQPQPFTHDPSVAETQAGLRREWLPEVAGYVTFTGGTQASLRVAYHSAPRPNSLMFAVPPVVAPTSVVGNTSLLLIGKGFNTGPLSGEGSQYNVASLVSAYQLQHTSPNEPQAFGPLEDHADLQYVGVTSDYGATGSLANTQIFFAVAMHGNFSTPKEIDVSIYIDKDRNGTDDYVLFNPRLTSSNQPVDVFLSSLVNLTTGASGFQEVLNPLYGADPLNPLQTYLYNNNVLVIPVAAGAVSPFGGAGLNLTAGQAFNYRVEAGSYEYGETIDVTPTLTYNPTAAALDFSDPTGSVGGPFVGVPWYFDTFGADNIPVAYNLLNHPEGAPLQILLLHHHNAGTNARTQVVSVQDLFKVRTRLSVTAVCSPDPAKQRVWKVESPFTDAKTFGWNILGSAQSGTATVPGAANGKPGEVTITTITQRNLNTIRIFMNGQLQDVASSTTERCAQPTTVPVPTNTPAPTGQVPTNTPAS